VNLHEFSPISVTIKVMAILSGPKFIVLSSWLLGAIAVVAACSSDQTGNGFGNGNGPTGSSGNPAPPVTIGIVTPPSDQGTACSADLQKVLTASGVVVQTCPAGQGCAGGKCVAACDAAAASKGSLGCDYVVATPSFLPQVKPPCFAVFLANGWTESAKIGVSRGAQSFDVTKFGRIPIAGQPESAWPAVGAAGLPPGEVAVLFVSSDPNSANGSSSTRCPVPTALNEGTAVVGGSGRGQGWKITASVPVTAYDIMPYGGAKSFLPSAELLFPTTAWGTNYSALLPPEGYKQNGPFWGQIVARDDNTKVEILPTAALPAGNGVAAASVNVKATYTLNAGEYIQFQGGADMSGSIISSDKPVSFTGGNGYTCYKTKTATSGGCDSAHQVTPPIAALGSTYVAAPWASRRGAAPESIAYRIMAPVAGTSLTYDPPVAGAPVSLAAGKPIVFESATPFSVRSQDAAHPFQLTQMMSGSGVTGAPNRSGDEEFVNIIAPAQFLQKYVFFTDPSYATTTLALTRSKSGGAFRDVNIRCSGKVANWKPVGTSGDVEVTTVDLVRDGKSVGSCKNGSQSAESDGPFGIMVWGLDVDASYAYPAGGNVASINAVVVAPIPN
jgi:IgGFc binding protein